MFEDLRIEHFTMPKPDGRMFAFYWEGDRHRYFYRSRWVWQQSNGPLPPGYHVHHRNADPSDDRLENLQAMPASEHLRVHGMGWRMQRPEWTCETCGVQFRSYPRGKQPRRFCSSACKSQAQRSTISR